MANKNGKAYGLTLLCPIINGSKNDENYSDTIRRRLESLPINSESPMAKVPNTYLCRFYILNDVFFQGFPANTENLKSKYLVFSANFHGDRDEYLRGMWNNAEEAVKSLWEHCVVFDKVKTADDFVSYIKECQVDNNLFFNGSTDDSLAEQLKSLYIKQEFSRFVYANQGLSAVDLQKEFNAFIEKIQPDNISEPTWQAASITTHEDNNYKNQKV